MDETTTGSGTLEGANYNPDGALVYKMANNMNFVGLWTIIYGVITCLGIITAIIGVPYILAGIRMRDSARYFKAYSAKADADVLKSALRLQSEFMNYFKWVVIITLIFIGLYIIGVILFFAVFASLLGEFAA